MVFQKTARVEIESAPVEAILEPVVINNYAKPKDPILDEGEAAVRFFHKLVHGVDNHQPQSKETGQALPLVSQYGLAMTKRVIEYAAGKARETNFPMQHFGAVLNYVSRAIADLERRGPDRSPARPALGPEAAADPLWKKGEQRLAILNAAQHVARFEKAKSELISQNPFLARNWKDGGSHEKIVRGRVIRDLASEPMDLMIPPPGLGAIYRASGQTQNLAR